MLTQSRDILQEGYDVSLLALQPPDVRPSPPANPHSTFYAQPSGTQETLNAPTVAYPSGVTSEDESAPLAPSSFGSSGPTTRRGSPDSYTLRLAAVPPVSVSNPRRAAQTYSERARAVEGSGRRDGSAEKGEPRAERRGGPRRRALWQRKGLVVGLAVLILLVSAGIGIGVGVGVGVMRRSGSDGGDGDGAPGTTGATSSGSDMAPTMAPPSAGAERVTAAYAPTEAGGEAAPVPTDAAATGAPSWEEDAGWIEGASWDDETMSDPRARR